MVENGAKVDVLTCKEVDLNFDGKKDIWVYYENSGNITNEEFDLDFDGKIDLWIYRQNNKIVRQELDTNFDGKPDIWKFYENEKLTRIERSTQQERQGRRVGVLRRRQARSHRLRHHRLGADRSMGPRAGRGAAAAAQPAAAGATPAAANAATAMVPQPPTVTPEASGAQGATPATTPAKRK